MITLFFDGDSYCFADSKTYKVGIWYSDINLALKSFYSSTTYRDHYCFTHPHWYTIIGTYNANSLHEFKINYPELLL